MTENKRGGDDSVGRRTFLQAAGGAGLAGIAGWFLACRLPDASTPRRAPDGQPPRPRLRQDLRLVPAQDGLLQVFDPRHRQGKEPVCAVNTAGAGVLRLLDGSQDIHGVSRALLAQTTPPPADTSGFTAGAACFVAALGQAGLLSAPFWVNIIDHEYST